MTEEQMDAAEEIVTAAAGDLDDLGLEPADVAHAFISAGFAMLGSLPCSDCLDEHVAVLRTEIERLASGAPETHS